MSVTSGFHPINSNVEDLLYDSEHVGKLYHGLYINGVSKIIGNMFVARAINSNSIEIDTGFAYFNGFYVQNDSKIVKTVDINSNEYRYLVIRFIENERRFDILVVPILEYNNETDLLLASIHKEDDVLKVKNLVGYSKDDLVGAPLLTGINQILYLTELIDSMEESYTTFFEEWIPGKQDYLETLLDFIYYHLDTDDQYNRLLSSINDKSNKIETIPVSVNRGDTNLTYQKSGKSIPSNAIINIRPKYINVAITKIEIINNSIQLTFLPADNHYDFFIDVFVRE